MSVMVADLKTFDAIYRKLELFQDCTVLGTNYNEALKTFLYNGGDLKSLVKNWLYLNELSYIRRYREDLEGVKPDLEPFLSFNSLKSIDTYQMLKSLEFLVYNIEIETIKEGNRPNEQSPFIISDALMHSYHVLIDIMHSCRMGIIAELPEYKKCKWGDL